MTASRAVRPIVFIGDSITDSGRRRTERAALGDGFVRLIADDLRARRDDRVVINSGINGDRVDDLLRRCDKDAVAHNPSLVTVLVGINDVWRRFDSDDPITATAFESTYRTFLTHLVGTIGPQLIMMEPFLVPVSDIQATWLEDLEGKRLATANLALEFDAIFIPLHRLLTEAATDRGAAVIAEDGVHPTAFGHRLIADAWMRSTI